MKAYLLKTHQADSQKCMLYLFKQEHRIARMIDRSDRKVPKENGTRRIYISKKTQNSIENPLKMQKDSKLTLKTPLKWLYQAAWRNSPS